MHYLIVLSLVLKAHENLLSKLCYKTVMSVHQSELIMTVGELSASVARPLSI